MTNPLQSGARSGAVIVLCLSLCGSAVAKKLPKKTTEQLRAEYLSTIPVLGQEAPQSRSTGSLWSASGGLADASGDYKAHNLNDLITVIVSVATSASQSGSVDSSRTFSTNSAITGLAGNTSTQSLNPLFAANSATALKGSGGTASATALNTSLSGTVIGVLPNGNLVIEAHQALEMNNQHEELIVRGIARPGDITPLNTVPSAALASLQIELKGKGIISDSVRSLNPVTRAVLWLFGF